MFKRRYLDYLKKSGLDLNRSGFESLRKFIVDELMTSDYAQTFLSEVGRGSDCLREVAVKARVVQASQTNNKGPDLCNNYEGNRRLQLTKPPPLCHV